MHTYGSTTVVSKPPLGGGNVTLPPSCIGQPLFRDSQHVILANVDQAIYNRGPIERITTVSVHAHNYSIVLLYETLL